MKRKTLLFILLFVIVAIAPIMNWHVDTNIIRGVVWRATMLMTFLIGYFWNKINYKEVEKRPTIKKLNKRLTNKSK